MNLRNIATGIARLIFGDDAPKSSSSGSPERKAKKRTAPKKEQIAAEPNISSEEPPKPKVEIKHGESRKQAGTKANIEPIPLDQRRWLTVKEMAARYPFTESSLRNLIYSAESYANFPKPGLRSNGFIDCIVRVAGQRKILIDTTKFESWLEAHKHNASDFSSRCSRR